MTFIYMTFYIIKKQKTNAYQKEYTKGNNTLQRVLYSLYPNPGCTPKTVN